MFFHSYPGPRQPGPAKWSTMSPSIWLLTTAYDAIIVFSSLPSTQHVMLVLDSGASQRVRFVDASDTNSGNFLPSHAFVRSVGSGVGIGAGCGTGFGVVALCVTFNGWHSSAFGSHQ